MSSLHTTRLWSIYIYFSSLIVAVHSIRPPPPPPPPLPLSSAHRNHNRNNEMNDDYRRTPSSNRKMKNYPNDDTRSETENTSTYNPIHYHFPSKSLDSEVKEEIHVSSISDKDRRDTENDSIPETGWTEQSTVMEQRGKTIDHFASPRKDIITRYTSTVTGKVRLGISSACVGSILGGFIGKSMFHQGLPFALAFSFIFLVMNLLRNDYGEMSRAFGMALLLLLRRLQTIRRKYKTGKHLKAVVGIGPRYPFPPILNEDEDNAENPWNYKPTKQNDPEFEMVKSLICMALIGSFCGGNIPLIPTWIGSSSGAVSFAFVSTMKNARGDLIRTMGMRVVAVITEAIDINYDLNIGKKTAIVSGKIADKLLILDRKHRIKDKVWGVITWIYDQVSAATSRVQEDIQERQDRPK